MTIWVEMPNQQIRLCNMNMAILGPFIEIMGIALTHFVKYSIVVIINLWPPDDVGQICPMRSKAHHENGHKDWIGCNAWEGWTKTWAYYWHLMHFLM